MNFQRTAPVIASILIILAVALLRDRSRAVAAIVATMPINVPLALWIVATAAGGEPGATAGFMRSVLIGIVPSVFWLGVVYLALRAGWGLWPAMAAGYVAWGVLVGLLFYSGVIRHI